MCICAYKTHIYAYFENAYLCIFGFAYLCIFCAYLCIWYFCIYVHIWFLHILAYLCLLCTYIAYLVFACLCKILHILYCILYCSIFYAYLNQHIIAYLPSCIFKHMTHISAYKMHIYAYFGLIVHIYCIFLICIFMHISCIFDTAYFVHISAYFNLHVTAYLPLCIFKLLSAYLHLLCLPRPINLTNIQTAAGAQRERCFFRRPNFLSFNRPHTRL